MVKQSSSGSYTLTGDDKGDIIIYQSAGNAPSLEVRLERDTVWLSQRQMANLFDKDTDTIGLHIRNVCSKRVNSTKFEPPRIPR